ncbi:hypothetical protein FF38_00803 [Lucilia cuprina]|uniref:Uncharacterized protein n=1 Tax=Lucilia cuprina TaxID=7375 RepID=A0A0L0BWP7_LUCCU|nr:hypothetical protein FF38_00803 [Lucilia cuprina]
MPEIPPSMLGSRKELQKGLPKKTTYFPKVIFVDFFLNPQFKVIVPESNFGRFDNGMLYSLRIVRHFGQVVLRVLSRLSANSAAVTKKLGLLAGFYRQRARETSNDSGGGIVIHNRNPLLICITEVTFIVQIGEGINVLNGVDVDDIEGLRRLLMQHRATKPSLHSCFA